LKAVAKKSFKLPINVEHDDTCDFSLEYRTFAYSSALNGKKDSFSFTVNRYTERLIIRVILTENMTKRELSYPEGTDDQGNDYRFEIRDAAEERMIDTEVKIKKFKETPKFKNKNRELVWKINEPKIGYRYKLYFTIPIEDK